MRYGSGYGQILFDNLMCGGSESSLFDCARNGIWENNCASDHSEDAGVVCNSEPTLKEESQHPLLVSYLQLLAMKDMLN